MTKKLVTFSVLDTSTQITKETRVNVSSVKKMMDSSFDYCLSDSNNKKDLYKACQDRAIEKLFGKGKWFREDNSGINGIGQIWFSVGISCASSHTGIVRVDSDFFDAD